MSDRPPVVSVIMAARNAELTLGEALRSIEQQSLTDWELIVCDDASTDSTPRILRDFASKHPESVRIVTNPTRSYLSHALNRCLKYARGEFVARMDADDCSLPERLKLQLKFLREHPEVHLVGTAMRRFDARGERDVVALPAAPGPTDMRSGPPFAHATVMVRREVFARLGGYRESWRTRRGQDYELWFRFFRHGYVGANLPNPLYLVREDSAAIRRRTLSARFGGFVTTVVGYRMLAFPFRWYLAPVVRLFKGIVPYPLVLAYRKCQFALSVYRDKQRNAVCRDK